MYKQFTVKTLICVIISAITLPLHIEEIDEKERDMFYNA